MKMITELLIGGGLLLGAIGGTSYVVGKFSDHDARLTRVVERIDAIEKTTRDGPCTQILSRQLTAIDLEKADVENKLKTLAQEYRCRPRAVSVAGASERIDDYAIMDMAADANAAAELFRELGAIDEELGVQPAGGNAANE